MACVHHVASDFANTTVMEQISAEYSQGGYFAPFAAEERSNALGSWPKGRGWSRRTVAKLTREKMDEGILVTLFYGGNCPACQDVMAVFEELGVPCTSIDFQLLGQVASEGEDERMGDVVRDELYSMDVNNEEPFVFLGTRYEFLDPALELQMVQLFECVHMRVCLYLRCGHMYTPFFVHAYGTSAYIFVCLCNM
jgi:hypothetical protein